MGFLVSFDKMAGTIAMSSNLTCTSVLGITSLPQYGNSLGIRSGRTFILCIYEGPTRHPTMPFFVLPYKSL